MAQVRFFTDEDIYGAIAPARRRSGFDAVSTPESGRLGETDESQLQWAAREGRVLVTFTLLISPIFIRSGLDRDSITVGSRFPNNGRLVIYKAAGPGRKACPRCGQAMSVDAVRCRHCHTEIEAEGNPLHVVGGCLINLGRSQIPTVRRSP